METKYESWISDYLILMNYEVLGECKNACTQMKKFFPELTITNGFVQSPLLENEEGLEHWWLKDKEGNIIDPTRSQYEYVEPITYIEIDDNHPARNMPRNKCPNCGKYFYGTGYLCSDKCEKEYIDYMEGKVEC